MPREDPPSYESVMHKLNKLVGHEPTPQKLLHAANELSQVDIDVLAANTEELPPWTPHTKEAFTIGMAKEMGSPDAAEYLSIAAKDAAAACRSVEAMFIELTSRLAAIDSRNLPPKEGPFAPRLAVLNKSFHQTVLDSKNLAVKIAIYGRKFDQVVIPLCGDKKISVGRRREMIEVFIKDAEVFSSESEQMTKRFFDLKSDFAIFVGSFSGWAADKEEADTKELERARMDLQGLNKKLSDLNISFYAISAIGTATLPATTFIALLSGPFAPIVMVGGLIVAGVTYGTALGLYIAIQGCQKDITAKQDQIKTLEESIQQLKVARGELEELGAQKLVQFSNNVDILALVWQTAHNDALEIKAWLETGEKEADMPEYMKASVDHAVSIYKTMADYLDQYADGVIGF